jgi:NADPH-dependent curcumin reductase CurA
MTTKKNREIILAKRPEGMPREEDFRLIVTEMPECKDGMVLVKTLYLSVDPYMRGRMNGVKTYISPFELDKTITGGIVGEVVETRSPDLKAGDIVTANLGWRDYNAADSREVRKIDPGPAPVSTALGILGMPGLTAYFGLLDIGKPSSGETVVVSGAAGAVGTLVGQIAKIKGCRVVGIAGSDVKTKYLIHELGFDAAINYKTTADIKKALKDTCPNGVDIYFDNVGGDISDAVMPLLNFKARVVLCGQISQYNMNKPEQGPRVQPYLLVKSALMKGFIVMDYADRSEEGIRQLAQWISQQKLKYTEHVVEGLENAPKAFIGLFTGENLGKQIVKVS